MRSAVVNENRIMVITPEMVDLVGEWQIGEIWKLNSLWEERVWAAYQSGERDFTVFENTDSVNIRGNGTVSIRFMSEQTFDEAIAFCFDNGLPSGAILTLIDRSGATPVYYTYTTTAETTELSATAFVKMGDPSVSFDGLSKDVVLQICYQQSPVSTTDAPVATSPESTSFVTTGVMP